ncbi:MAG: DUF2752 domain-containing protein [Lachnospiraceae bacterium]|nr:DUF2752 domain-containing protein [Lachnospiraceae bacterium]
MVHTLYRLGKPVFIAGLFGIVLYYMKFFDPIRPCLYCYFKKVTGLYCPGCGVTRAVDSILSGHFLKSLYYNAAVLYFSVFYIYVMIREFVTIHFGGKMLKDKTVYILIYTGIGVILIQWLVKLAALLIFHYRWM